MSEPRVGIFVDYESPLAHGVAGRIWSGLSTAALGSGYTRATALWESLRTTRSPETLEGSRVYVFVVGQDCPDAIDCIAPASNAEAVYLYGVVVAVPDRPSPLSGSLLYQGVERLKESGVRTGLVEPALLHALPEECESYARRLLERLTPLLEA